ncbi:Putative membrane spanning protein [Borrelia parkeri SLO]|uniref:Membrane spanning protein n=1 Tax=Borrelia parkeri SLO TaxID=1313294 RepID=A0ABN4CBP9_BORPR|nr:Putative membrane spanning protein [Borrelia parkeri SLO]
MIMIDINSINQIKDIFSKVLDVTLISILVYYIYKNVINSYSVNLLKGMIIITSIGIVSYYFNLYTINWLCFISSFL